MRCRPYFFVPCPTLASLIWGGATWGDRSGRGDQRYLQCSAEPQPSSFLYASTRCHHNGPTAQQPTRGPPDSLPPRLPSAATRHRTTSWPTLYTASALRRRACSPVKKCDEGRCIRSAVRCAPVSRIGCRPMTSGSLQGDPTAHREGGERRKYQNVLVAVGGGGGNGDELPCRSRLLTNARHGFLSSISKTCARWREAAADTL